MQRERKREWNEEEKNTKCHNFAVLRKLVIDVFVRKDRESWERSGYREWHETSFLHSTSNSHSLIGRSIWYFLNGSDIKVPNISGMYFLSTDSSLEFCRTPKNGMHIIDVFLSDKVKNKIHRNFFSSRNCVKRLFWCARMWERTEPERTQQRERGKPPREVGKERQL